MMFVAPKAPGSQNFVAPRAKSSMSKEAFAAAFGASPVHEIGGDTNPFTLAQLAGELEKRIASANERRLQADVGSK